MSFFLRFLLLGTMAAVALVQSSVAQTCEQSCKTAKCTTEENPVWTTDGRTCRVYRNTCIWSNRNCIRKRSNQSVFYKICKEKCQNICKKTQCSDNNKPVCAAYRGRRETFCNLCTMWQQTCLTGESWVLQGQTDCENL